MTAEQLAFMQKVGYSAQLYYPIYKILPSLTIAQCIKESGWGKSALSSKYNNHFGLKWTSSCGCDYVVLKTKEFVKGKYVVVNAKFRRYPTFEEGIKGYYDFLSGYKRYKNLIGVTDPLKACQLIQADGYATAPNYADSLYHDYIVRYKLTDYDVPTDKPTYILGFTYVLNTDLYIRNEPNGYKRLFVDITENAKEHGFADTEGYAILKSGTRVTCQDTACTGSSMWIKIPSGWICGYNSSKVYVTEV